LGLSPDVYFIIDSDNFGLSLSLSDLVYLSTIAGFSHPPSLIMRFTSKHAMLRSKVKVYLKVFVFQIGRRFLEYCPLRTD
jgi:hypothetical protein